MNKEKNDSYGYWHDEAKEEFYFADMEVFDDKLVFKIIKCAMQEYNGEFIENLKKAQEALPEELLETLRSTSQNI